MPIDTKQKEDIIKLYRDTDITFSGLAQQYGISMRYVQSILAGVYVQGKSKRDGYSLEFKEEVVQEYKSGRYTVEQIANKYGIGTSTIYLWNREYDDGVLSGSTVKSSKFSQDLVDNIIHDYLVNGFGTRRLASKYDIYPATIQYILQRNNVYKGNRGIQHKRTTGIDDSLIISRYQEGDYTIKEVADYFNISATKVYNVLKDAGVERNKSDKKIASKSNSISEQVIRYYKSGLFTHENLAKKYDVSTRTISRILDKAGIEAIITAKYAPSSRIAEIMSDVKSDIEKGEDEFEVAIKYNVTLDTITKIVNNDVNNPKVSKAEMKAELKAQIVKSYEENKDIQSIAQQFEVKENFVRIALKDAGVDTHNTKLSRAKESVIESFKMGKEIELIAQEHELSKPSVIKILTEAGFETRTNKTIKAKDNIIQQFNLGVDIKQIAEDNDVSLATVTKVLKQEGLYQSSGDLTKEKAKQLYYQGLDIESIAGKLGLGVSYTKNILKDQGIDWTVKPEIKKTQVPEQITDLMIMKIKDAWNTYHDIDMVVKSQGFGEPFREVAIRELVKLGKIPSPDEREQP